MTPKIETPRGSIVIGKNGKAELKWNTKKFVSSGSGGGKRGFHGAYSWQGRFSNAQWFVDNEVLRYCDKFTPFRTGMLIKSSALGTDVGSGEVAWIAPYAKAQYYRPGKVGSITGPQRGPYWFERMKAVYGRKIIEGARRIAGGGT